MQRFINIAKTAEAMQSTALTALTVDSAPLGNPPIGGFGSYAFYVMPFSTKPGQQGGLGEATETTINLIIIDEYY